MRTQPLYNRHGIVAAFLLDDTRIISTNGRPVAWLKGENVYDYAGIHKGWWQDKFMLGHDGGVLLWMPGALVGFITPVPRIPPIPPIPQFEPYRPFPRFPPYRPFRKYGWSNLEFP